MKLKFKKQTWQVQGRKALRDSFGDYDKDRVINMFDCAPRNFRLQGAQHKLTQEQINYNKGVEELMRKEREKKVAQEDQLGFANGDGEKKASENITGITKRWKRDRI